MNKLLILLSILITITCATNIVAFNQEQTNFMQALVQNSPHQLEIKVPRTDLTIKNSNTYSGVCSTALKPATFLFIKKTGSNELIGVIKNPLLKSSRTNPIHPSASPMSAGSASPVTLANFINLKPRKRADSIECCSTHSDDDDRVLVTLDLNYALDDTDDDA
jgi:hypothetical protein